MNFNSHADVMVEVAARLINVASAGFRQGRPYDVPAGRDLTAAIGSALRSAGRRVSALDDGQSADLAASAIRLRAVFERVERRDLDRAVRSLNALLAEFQPTPYLDRHDGEPWHLHYHSRDAGLAASWAASCALALAVVLGSENATRLGVCSAPACDGVYVDVSRNGTRRFCSTACQSRVKAAAHRARSAG